jgi:nitrogen fixation NifU-like protein
VAKELGGLPPIKMHCAVLAAKALKKAIEEYKAKVLEKK